MVNFNSTPLTSVKFLFIAVFKGMQCMKYEFQQKTIDQMFQNNYENCSKKKKTQ